MGYSVDTTVVVHSIDRWGSQARTALLAPLPNDRPFEYVLSPTDGSEALEAVSGGVYRNEDLRISMTQVADWFTTLPWAATDTAVLTANDGERTLTVVVVGGSAVRVRTEMHENSPPAVEISAGATAAD